VPQQEASSACVVPGDEILRKIGHGGMGEVCVARQADTDRHVAIKSFSPQSARLQGELKQRFDREARLMSGFTHPNIVTLIGHGTVVGQDPGNPFFHATLAGFLATCPDRKLRDATRAVSHARTACELSHWRDWRSLKVFASAYRATGDPDAAMTWCEKALELAPPSQKRAVQVDLDAYRKLKPFLTPDYD